jgi:hypothetical protein
METQMSNKTAQQHATTAPMRDFMDPTNPARAKASLMSGMKAVKSVVSSGIAATGLVGPSTIMSNRRASQANRDADTLQTARKYDNASNWNLDNTPSDAQKARFAADQVKAKYKK